MTLSSERQNEPAEAATISKLSVDQVKSFDKEYVTDEKWQVIRGCIDRELHAGFTFLDVGCGNGVFSDRVLSEYPEATGVVVDSSEHLISLNRKHSRKRILLGDISQIDDLDLPKVDVVFCNWLLHHLVTTGSYRDSRRNIAHALKALGRRLKPGGFLSVCENDVNGLIDGWSARIIFAVTSLHAAAPIVRKLGANTAGVGVCFLSHAQWSHTFESLGYELRQYHPFGTWRRRWPRDAMLLLRSVDQSHYWLRRDGQDSIV